MAKSNQAKQRISIVRIKYFRISASNSLELRQFHTDISNLDCIDCHDILHCQRNLLGWDVLKNVARIHAL